MASKLNGIDGYEHLAELVEKARNPDTPMGDRISALEDIAKMAVEDAIDLSYDQGVEKGRKG
jgi:hypothetical protein